MAPIVALSEALSMPHLAMHNASSQAAAMAIKTDQNNHFFNVLFLHKFSMQRHCHLKDRSIS
jgi:hypothetical protein